MTAIRAREPRERDPDYCGWIASLPCVACARWGMFKQGVHVAHLRASSLEHGKRETGKAEKPHDRWTTPLCPYHHMNGGRKSQTYYLGGEEAFWGDLGIDPFELCLELNTAYVNGGNGRAVIATLAARAGR